MMQSEKKITRENALTIIKKFAKEYRKELGKAPGEIIIVGGGSIMLNYKFREATQDFDVILRTASGISDVITRFADENDLPRDWMNSDFIKTASYSAKLAEISKHFCSLNNNTLEIRTVSGKYLIAMKIRAHREYRNDISDVAGILIEEREKGNNISFPDVNDAYVFLYEEAIDSNVEKVVRELFDKDTDELKKIYAEQNEAEASIGTKVESYIDDGADINTRSVDDVIARIKEKMKS